MLGYCLKHSGLWTGLGQIFLVLIDVTEYHLHASGPKVCKKAIWAEAGKRSSQQHSTVVSASSSCLDFLPQLPSRMDCKKGV